MLPGTQELRACGIADALVTVDAAGLVVGTNEPFDVLVGLDPGELVGRVFCEILRPRDADGAPITGWHSSTRLRGARGVPPVEIELVHAAGRTIKVSVTVAYHRVDGEFDGGVLCLRDLAHRQFESAAARAVATVSHEIRSPLTGIRGFASLLLNRGSDISEVDTKDMLAQIVHDAERMTRLVTELLEVSRLEAGRLVVGAQPVDIDDVIDEALSQARANVDSADLFDVDVSPCETAVALADRDKLLQIMTNLIENAFKYGESPLEIDVHYDDDDIEIEVRDGGFIVAGMLVRLFSKYWRRERPDKPSGTGLGLYISKQLAEVQGGTLEASSSVDDGTLFRLTMPRA